MKYQAHIFDQDGYIRSSLLLNSRREALEWLSIFGDIPNSEGDIEEIPDDKLEEILKSIPSF